LSKLFLTPQFGPRQRMFALLTDAVLDPDPLLPAGSVCDNCGQCAKTCPGDAIPLERTIEFKIGDRVFSHAPLDCEKCRYPHIGWDPRYSPFLKKDSSPDNPPDYYKFLDTRFRHHTICGGRGCIRKCMDHLERTGRIEKQYQTLMVEGEQWEIDNFEP
jgi:ferredoxin